MSLLVTAVCVTTAYAAPIAEWVPLAGLSADVTLRMQHLRRSRCLPEVAEVAFPVYPRAVVIEIDWGRVKPICASRDGWSDLGAVVLLSTDDEQQVAAWYADRLERFAQYPSDRGLLFIEALITDFLWDRDYYKYPNVSIARATDAWLAAGYRTVIELNRPAPP